MSISSISKNVIMKFQGFKKIPLTDTKGVLDQSTNFKWQKKVFHIFSPNETITTLPSGTTIRKTNEDVWGVSQKHITKSNGDKTSSKLYSDGSYEIYKNGELYSEKSPLDIIRNLNKKAALNLNAYKESLVTKIAQTKTGKEVIMKFDKNNKLLSWTRPVDDLKVAITHPLGKYKSIKISAGGEIMTKKVVAKFNKVSQITTSALNVSKYPRVTGYNTEKIYKDRAMTMWSNQDIDKLVETKNGLFEKETLKNLFLMG